MIQAVSKNNTTYNFCKRDSKYNEFGNERMPRDMDFPSNKALNRDVFTKTNSDKKKKITTFATLFFGLSALFYGILKKPNIF